MSQTHLGIVIVNYRTPDLVADCLDSIADEDRGDVDLSVIVVENASGDDSAPRIQRHIDSPQYRHWCTLVESPTNEGFAAGNNVGIQHLYDHGGLPDYVWLVNPDAYLRPGALRAMVRFMDQRPRVGIAGSRVEHADEKPLRGAFRFPSIRSEFEGRARTGPISRLLAGSVVSMPLSDQPREVDWVTGASFMIRRSVIEQIGLMDPGYFLYFEELDYCRRARDAGWVIAENPAARVVHLESQSTGIKGGRQRERRRKPAYWFRSRHRYFAKHTPLWRHVAADAAWVAGAWFCETRRLLARRPSNQPPRLIRDFIDHSVFRTGRAVADTADRIALPTTAEATDHG